MFFKNNLPRPLIFKLDLHILCPIAVVPFELIELGTVGKGKRSLVNRNRVALDTRG